MRRISVGLALAAVAAIVVAGIGPADSRAAPSRLEREIYSPAVEGRLGLAVYLPADYATSKARFPVVYFLHGLPATPTSYQASAFIARAVEQVGGEAIVVAPQGARANDTDPEYLDWGRGRNWSTAISRDVVHYVDSHFRTIRNRDGRALIGLSAGGYGAMIIAVNNLATYGAVESWSGYFHPTDPSGTHALDLGSAEANANASAHTYVKRLERDQARRPTLIGFYVGRSDRRFLSENIEFDRELRAGGVRHVFDIYPGGHQQSLWTSHAAAWLALALRHLAPPT
ncbi:MAG TPA: alpha/beta hydrolase-fold protein [Gaiellaceae bacterium]|nr:alpha/beta hydrolase-fold protein [Gaiellaceae bacterium]